MIGRALIVAGAIVALITASWGGLLLYAAGLIILMVLIGAAHRAWYR